jgi:hypothetical protein
MYLLYVPLCLFIIWDCNHIFIFINTTPSELFYLLGMFMKNILMLVVFLSVVADCASRSSNISASYVSSSAYSSLSCAALKEEAVRVSYSAAAASGRQDSAATGDAVKTGVGLVLFWPVLFFNEGNGAKAADVARLKGEMQALEVAAAQKNCNITFRSR